MITCTLRVSHPQRKNLGAPIYNCVCKRSTLGLVVLQQKSNELLSQIIRQSRNHRGRKSMTHMWYFGLFHTRHFCFLSWFWRRILVDLHLEWGGGSISGTVTRYMQDSSGFEPQWGKKFCLLHTQADRSWGPQSLLYNEHQGSFPAVKRPERGVQHRPPRSAEIHSGADTLCALMACSPHIPNKK